MLSESSQAARPELLVADDNRVIADVIRLNLERAGFGVRVARDGVEAWNLLQSQAFDLMITDYQMPGMTGEELCRKLRNDARLVGLPVILLSAKGLELDMPQLTQELALSAIMFKPFSPVKLIECVEHSLLSHSTKS